MQIIKPNIFLLITVALSMVSSIAGAQSQVETKDVAAEIDEGPWDTPSQLALHTARNTTGFAKPHALRNVALALFHAGKEGPAGDVVIALSETLESTQYSSDLRSVDLRNLRSVAQLEMTANFKEFRKQRILEMFDKDYTAKGSIGSRSKPRALYELVNAQANAGETDKAKEIANGISDRYHRSHALILIADREDDKSALLTLNKALTTAEMIKEPRETSSEKEFTRYILAGAFAKAGDAKQAMTIANSIESRYVPVRNRIALALAERGDREEALAFVEQALERGRHALDQTKAAKVLLKLGEQERATTILKQALGEAQESGHSLCAIGWELDKLGEKALALEALNQAIEVAHTTSEIEKLSLLRNIGDILLNLGHEELALKTLGQSIWRNEEGTAKSGIAYQKLANINQPVMVLATEIMGDDYRGKRRMKDAFTPREKRFAKRLVQLGQAGDDGHRVRKGEESGHKPRIVVASQSRTEIWQ